MSFFTPAPLASGPAPAAVVDAADFDGTNDYLLRGANLTGIADSKQLTLVSWLRFDTLAFGQRMFGGAANLISNASRGIAWSVASGNITLLVRDASAGIVSQISHTYSATGVWNCFLLSMDFSNSALRHFYQNNASVAPSWGAYLNVAVGYSASVDWVVGAAPDGTQKMNGGMGPLWFKSGVYVDFSVEANRRKFISASGKPIYLGSNGGRPGLGIPDVYLNLDDGEAAANYATNRGTGGNFSVTGALSTYPSSPSD